MVKFYWTVVWNYTLSLSCTGAAGNQLQIAGEIFGGGLAASVSTTTLYTNTIVGPGSFSGGSPGTGYLLSITLGGALVLGGSYYLDGWLQTNVYTDCTGGAGLANSQMDLGIGSTVLTMVSLS